MMPDRFVRYRSLAIVSLAIVAGVIGGFALAHWMPNMPYDYAVYMQGARMVRAGIDPHARLPYWYPLPIVLFTTLPWSFLPDQFAWVFAFIPLGLLHLRFGRNAPWSWLFFPLLINVTYAQAEGWLLWPLFWLLQDAPLKSSIGILGLMFKPAYGMLLVPYRVIQWIRARRWRDLGLLAGVGSFMLSVAFVVDPAWHWHFINGVMHRAENPELRMRNMTMWAFVERGELWLVPLVLLCVAFVLLAIVGWRTPETRGHVLLSLSLFAFPNGLNPVSSMMVLPFVETRNEILVLVATSWLVAGLEIVFGGFGGFYLVIVFVALALRLRRAQAGAQ